LDYHTKSYDNFVVIPCEIIHSNNLINSLKYFTRISEMKGNNPWYINEYTSINVIICTKIYQSPKILFFHLQRFSFDLNGGGKMKNNSRFEFPDEIDIQSFLVLNHPNTLYQLVGVINHSSSASSGHYISYHKFIES
jgi:ubiquitin C-terminal hydrolase